MVLFYYFINNFNFNMTDKILTNQENKSSKVEDSALKYTASGNKAPYSGNWNPNIPLHGTE